MVKTIDKKTFLNNLGLFVCTREKVLYNFKSRLFPIKDLDKSSTCEPTFESVFQPRCKQHLKQNKNKATKAKTKSKISSLKLYEEVLNKTKNEAKKI